MGHDLRWRDSRSITIWILLLHFDQPYDSTRRDGEGRWLRPLLGLSLVNIGLVRSSLNRTVDNRIGVPTRKHAFHHAANGDVFRLNGESELAEQSDSAMMRGFLVELHQMHGF